MGKRILVVTDGTMSKATRSRFFSLAAWHGETRGPVETVYEVALDPGDERTMISVMALSPTWPASPDAVLVLGRKLARDLAVPEHLHHLKLAPLHAGFAKPLVAIVPHPAALNRWWARPMNAAKGRMFLRGVFENLEHNPVRLAPAER